MNRALSAMTQRFERRRQVLAGLAALAAAPALRAREAAAPSFRIGVIKLPPWVIPDAAAAAGSVGISIDLVSGLIAESGVELEAVLVPLARAKSMLLSRHVDMMFAYESSQLQRATTALAPLGEDDVLLVGRPGIQFQTLKELQGRTIGHLRGADYDPAIYSEPGITRYETNNYEQGLYMLKLERIDAFVIPGAALPYCLKRLNIAREQLGSIQVLRKTGVTLYVSRAIDDAALIGRLNKACERLRAKQVLQRLIKLYGT